jgi:hypothetical protein
MNSNTNRLLVAKLEDKKASASRGLDTCHDVADDVWSEFKRQAIIEIYQAQQTRVKQVRDECLSIVNKCYDEKISQLKNFANIDSQMLIGQSVTTAESLCKEKLDSCSNVFGGGSTGLQSLLEFVKNVGSAKISENCKENMDNYIHKVCAVTGDLSHSYPYSCRVRNPGSYDCEKNRWLSSGSSCPEQSGSVYELLVKYARENCVRSDYFADQPLPSEVMEYVNNIFDGVLYDMRLILKTECETYSGEWMDDSRKSNIELYIKFVSASDYWGACIKPYCMFQGDAWLDANGVKQCCALPNATASESCNGTSTCACETITCPSGATINTSLCDSSENIISTSPPTSGGCIGRIVSLAPTMQPYCKCSSNYYSVPLNYNAVTSPGVASGDQGKCWPQCAVNSIWDTTCLVQDPSNTLTGCIAKYCRCKPGYKFVSASISSGSVISGAAAVLPMTLRNNKNNVVKKNKSGNDSIKKNSGTIARPGLPAAPPINLSFYDRCECVSPSCAGSGVLVEMGTI